MNRIIIELCEEDRARLDRLTEALERKSCDACVGSALSWAEQVARGKDIEAKKALEPDPVQQKLADTLAKATETPAPADTHPVGQELPWGDPVPEQQPAPAPAPAPAPEVSLAEFQKALTLKCAESKDPEAKTKVRALINQYAPAASQVPADKRAEILAKLEQI